MVALMLRDGGLCVLNGNFKRKDSIKACDHNDSCIENIQNVSNDSFVERNCIILPEEELGLHCFFDSQNSAFELQLFHPGGIFAFIEDLIENFPIIVPFVCFKKPLLSFH
jgi:hypothetical protein